MYDMSLNIDDIHPQILNVGLARHMADWNWKNVNSSFARLYYIVEGTAKIVLPDGIHELIPGHMYFVPAFTEHSCICDSRFTHYYVHIYEDMNSSANLFEDWAFPVEIKAEGYEEELFARLCSINPDMNLAKSDPSTYDNNSTLIRNLSRSKHVPSYIRLETRGIILQLLASFFKHAVPKIDVKDDRIRNVIGYVRTHLSETINLDEIVDSLCLSKDYFIRLFKQETGVTPMKYINQKKIERAQLILATKDMSVKNVALFLGFEDFSYFNRVFKKATGVTPNDYRRRLMQDT